MLRHNKFLFRDIFVLPFLSRENSLKCKTTIVIFSVDMWFLPLYNGDAQ